MSGDHLRQLRRTADSVDSWNDAFGKQIADGTRNAVDIPAFYDFNPERHRLYLNDSRVSPEDVPAKFTDEEADFLLEPAAGDKMEIHTAERPRYIVGYESVASLAAKGETELGAGDTFTCGLRDRSDPENLAYFEINGDSPNRVVLVGSGTEVAAEEFEFPGTRADDLTIGYQTPIRYEIQFNWYNVGRYLFKISYSDDSRPVGDRQVNKVVGELTVDDDFGTGDAAFHLFHELDATTSGQQLRTGSYGYNVLGNIEETTRTKGARLTGLSYGGSGDYEPLAAIRIDESRGNVYSQLTRLNVFPDGGSGQLLCMVTDADQTDASGFSTPLEHSPSDSVIEQTTTVTEFPDQDGNIVTSDPNPNGYQIGLATYEDTGTGTNARSSSLGLENKRPLYEDDVAIFLYKADTATSRSVNLTYFTEQDW